MTSKAYTLQETPLLISGAAGADHAWSVEGLANGAGRVSVQIDLGAAARAFEYDWSAEALGQATPVQYGTLDFYIATAPADDSTQIDGDVGAADAALGDVDQLKNLELIGSLTWEEADTTKMVASGEFECHERYLTLVCDNNVGAAINATDSNFIFKLTPRAVQGQDA